MRTEDTIKKFGSCIEMMSKNEKKSLSRVIREFLSEKFSKQVVKAKEDSVRSIIGIGNGDGTAVAREHDRFLYAKRKKR
ncbi:MAG: hypothetical protein HY957_05260 [Nitrospirae bacterium]|nr:hypothetical protein [Nitrospirota bacterium]